MKRICAACASLILFASSGFAQAKPDAPAPTGNLSSKIDFTASWRGRGEFLDFFDQGGAESGRYAFGASVLRLGIGQKRKKLDWLVEIEQPSLLNLPNNATLPAP